MGGVWIFSGAMHCALCICHRLPPGINLGVTMGICQGTGRFQTSSGKERNQDVLSSLKVKGREIWCVHLAVVEYVGLHNQVQI